MMDLTPPLSEAMNNIAAWRNRYGRSEYPHKIVVNMMYRAYSTRLVFQAFSRGELPDGFSDFQEAIQYVMQFYSMTASSQVHQNLLYWMQSRPTEQVGTICTQNYENLATKAEYDSKAKEEIEFSYAFEMLNDMCVLYWIAFRLSGKSAVDAISAMTGVIIEEIPGMDYTVTKQVFQQLLVARFMNFHYTPLP
jgi:hypothetical protein